MYRKRNQQATLSIVTCMRRALCLLPSIVLSCGLHGATQYTWDAENPQTSFGSNVSIELDGGKIASMAAALTGPQRGAIRCRKPGTDTLMRVKLDENGYVLPKAVGFAISVM